MDDVNVLLEPVRASLHAIGDFLPRVLLALLILLAGWLLARGVRFAVVRALRAINFGVMTQKSGVDRFLQQGGGRFDTIGLLGGLFYWLAILAAFMVASNSLGLAYVTDLIGRVVLFLPKVVVAVLIIAFGAYFAGFIATALAAYCRSIGLGDGDALARLAFYAILVFVVLIAIDALGVGDIIRQTFLILVAAVAFALALAFGLGGRKRATELLERWSRARAEREAAQEPRRPVI